MGGLVIMLATILAWLIGSFIAGVGPSWSGWSLLVLFVGLGLIGLLDDGIKIFRQRSLGLHAGAKIIGQILVRNVFAPSECAWHHSWFSSDFLCSSHSCDTRLRGVDDRRHPLFRVDELHCRGLVERGESD